MKNLKRNIFALIAFSLLIYLSCKKEDLTLIEPNHRVIFTSEMDFENKINVHGEIALGDVSAGVVSRIWTFPEGVADIIDSDNDVTSTEATVRAIFHQVGDHPIKLHQVFKGPTYVGTTQQGNELDTTIIIRVLDSLSVSIQAHYVNVDGSMGDPINLSDNAENEIPASRVVRYTPIAIGEPVNYRLEFEGGDPEVVEGPQEFIDVKYKRLGSYGISFGASRSRPFGQDQVSFENLIKVIPSTDPVTLDEVTEKDGKIAIVYSREIDAATLVPSDFSVSIKNLWNVFTPAVTSAELDPQAGNIILLTLDNESIYNDDEIKVSYPLGEITSSDGIKADTFTDAILVFRKVNILKDTQFDYSFENSTVDNWIFLGWETPFEKYSFSFSSEQVYHGNRSMYCEFDENGGMIIGNKDSNGEDILIPVEKGQDYELGLWVYLVEVGNTSPMALLPDIRIYWTPETNWGIGPNPELNFDFPIGEWVYSSDFVKFNDDQAGFWIRGFNGANPEKVKVYVDNITLSKVRLRP